MCKKSPQEKQRSPGSLHSWALINDFSHPAGEQWVDKSTTGRSEPGSACHCSDTNTAALSAGRCARQSLFPLQNQQSDGHWLGETSPRQLQPFWCYLQTHTADSAVSRHQGRAECTTQQNWQDDAGSDEKQREALCIDRFIVLQWQLLQMSSCICIQMFNLCHIRLMLPHVPPARGCIIITYPLNVHIYRLHMILFCDWF